MAATLVTGGAGFIGSHPVEALMNENDPGPHHHTLFNSSRAQDAFQRPSLFGIEVKSFRWSSHGDRLQKVVAKSQQISETLH